jgi:uncharacterized protein (TIGR02246 family)
MLFGTPEALAAAFADAFQRRDQAQLAALFTEDALLAPQPGVVVSGAERSAAMAAFLSINGPFQFALRQTYQVGDVALLVADWMLEGVTPGGEGVQLRGATADVAKRGADGGWRYLIDCPFGTA